MRGGPKFFGTALPRERWEGTENVIYLNLQTGNHKEKLNEQQKVALLHNNENQHNHAGYSFVCCFSIIHHVYLTVELFVFLHGTTRWQEAGNTTHLLLQNTVLLWLADASWGSTNWAPGDTSISGSVLRRFILPFIFFNIVAYGEGEVIGRGKKNSAKEREEFDVNT